MSEAPESKDMKPTCCLLRRKILIGILAVLPEQACGVSDVELADVISYRADGGAPVIAFKFCGWCGKPFSPQSETRITEPFAEEDREGDEWKKGLGPG